MLKRPSRYGASHYYIDSEYEDHDSLPSSAGNDATTPLSQNDSVLSKIIQYGKETVHILGGSHLLNHLIYVPAGTPKFFVLSQTVSNGFYNFLVACSSLKLDVEIDNPSRAEEKEGNFPPDRTFNQPRGADFVPASVLVIDIYVIVISPSKCSAIAG